MLGSIISAGASLAGGLLGAKQADKQAELQKQFAKKAIRWKVKDAKAAGVHPLYALGAPTTSYAPQQIGDPLGGSIAAMGQDIGRAIDATSTPGMRGTKYSRALQALNLERAGLQNQVLRARLNLLSQPGSPIGPPDEVTGQQHMPSRQGAVALPGTMVQPRNIRYHKLKPPEFTPTLQIGGVPIKTSKAWSGGQAFQDRYGEPGEWLLAFPTMAADAYETWGKPWWEGKNGYKKRGPVVNLW